MKKPSTDSLFEHAVWNSSDKTPEGKLGASILSQAMIDVRKGNKTKKDITYWEGQEAIRYLTRKNKDLIFVCEMAGLDIGFVLRMAELQIKYLTKR